MFHFGVISHSFTKETEHDFTSLASPKGEMESPFSWNSFLKSPRSSTLCFGEPTLANLNQETEFCITKHIPLCDSAVHTGTPFSVPRSPSETNRVSDCHSSLVTTPSSRRILEKPKNEVAKVLIHHVGKNGEHFYGKNLIYEYPSKRHIKSKSGLNHGSSLMEVDWGRKLRVNLIHECMPSEVHWGDHDPSLDPVDEYSISEVDWGTHDSSYFLYLVYIEFDVKPKRNFLTQELWGVGSTQVPFVMCTLQIPPKLAAQVLALNFSYLVYF